MPVKGHWKVTWGGGEATASAERGWSRDLIDVSGLHAADAEAALVLAGFGIARQVLMPLINRARDAELAGRYAAARRFRRLHLVSVVINAFQWLAVLAALIMVLM